MLHSYASSDLKLNVGLDVEPNGTTIGFEGTKDTPQR